MANRKFLGEMLAIALAFGMMGFTGCDTGTTDPGGGGTYTPSPEVNEPLPEVSGENALSGKTYFERYYGEEKIDFAATGSGALEGTYSRKHAAARTYGPGVKFTYTAEIETGTYSWNDTEETVTLKPGKVDGGDHYAEYDYNSGNGTIIVEGDFSGLLTPEQLFNYWMRWAAEDGFTNADAAEESDGLYTTVAEFVSAMVNEEFTVRTYTYSFIESGAVLFLEAALPANKGGTDELKNETYYGMKWDFEQDKPVKDERQVYTFAASDNTYTFTQFDYEVQTGTYAYGSTRKEAWLGISKLHGKTREQYFADEDMSTEGHHAESETAYRAAKQTTLLARGFTVTTIPQLKHSTLGAS